MRILTPYGIECFARARTRRQRAWAWVREHWLFVALQTLCLVSAPAIFFFSAMIRGYHAIGSEALIVVAPLLVKAFQWIIHYDDEDGDLDI